MSEISSYGARVAQLMSSAGFAPRGPADGRYVEYYKDYADTTGRVARCTVLFNRSGMIDQGALAGFVVTVQAEVPPVVEEIRKAAPQVMHGDMSHIVSRLSGQTAPLAADDTVICNRCAKQTAEFAVTKSGLMVCPDCLIQAVGNASEPG